MNKKSKSLRNRHYNIILKIAQQVRTIKKLESDIAELKDKLNSISANPVAKAEKPIKHSVSNTEKPVKHLAIKHALAVKGFSITYIAHELDVTINHASLVISGRRKSSRIETYIEQLLGRPFDELLRGEAAA